MFGAARIRYQGQPEPVTVSTLPVDMVLWERTTKRKVGDGKGVGIEDMARVTFMALRRQSMVSPETSFDEWLATLTEYEPVKDPEMDPSQPVVDPSSE